MTAAAAHDPQPALRTRLRLSRDAALDAAMIRYARGEDAAFGVVYTYLAPRLYPSCLRLTRHEAEADDVFQEALLRLHCARASYVPGSSVVCWAFAVMRSVYLDRLRRIKRRPEDLVPTDDVADGLDAAHLAFGPPATAPLPESQAHANALIRIVHRALECMSEPTRAAYVLLRHEELTVHEAAAALGTTADAVKQRAHRADASIREAATRGGW